MSFKNIQYKEKLIQKIFKMLRKANNLIFLNICFINLNIKFVANHMVHAWLPPKPLCGAYDGVAPFVMPPLHLIVLTSMVCE